MSKDSSNWKLRGLELKKQRAFIAHCLMWDTSLSRTATRSVLRRVLNMSLETINKVLEVEDNPDESINPSTARKIITKHADYFGIEPVIYSDLLYQIWDERKSEKEEPFDISNLRQKYLKLLSDYRMSHPKVLYFKPKK